MFAFESFGYALARGISVLVISCPCALGRATLTGDHGRKWHGSKNGFCSPPGTVSLETTGKTEIVVLDKTGTITLGEPKSLADIFSRQKESPQGRT